MGKAEGMELPELPEIDDWRQAWRRLQEMGSENCPPEESLAALAVEGSGLSPEERLALGDHVVSCRRCAALYRDLLDLHREAQRAAPQALGDRPAVSSASPLPARAKRAWILAAAAALAAVSLAAWSFWLLGENRRLSESLAARVETPPASSPAAPAREPQEVQAALGRLAELSRAAEAQSGQIARLESEIAALSAPRFNVPVVDLDPAGAVARGDAAAEARKVEVPAGAGLVTLILNPSQPPAPGSYTLEILGAGGRRVWSGGGLSPTAYDNFSLAVPRPLLPDGRYRLRLTTGRGKLVETYEVQIATLAAR